VTDVGNVVHGVTIVEPVIKIMSPLIYINTIVNESLNKSLTAPNRKVIGLSVDEQPCVSKTLPVKHICGGIPLSEDGNSHQKLTINNTTVLANTIKHIMLSFPSMFSKGCDGQYSHYFMYDNNPLVVYNPYDINDVYQTVETMSPYNKTLYINKVAYIMPVFKVIVAPNRIILL